VETITITEEDRVAAENIMEQYLSDRLPDGDFSKGSSLRDLVVGGLAYVFAFLRKEGDLIRARQSLLLLSGLSGADVDDAVDEILSNWFLERKDGTKATGTATVYLSQKEDVTIPTTASFYRAGKEFKINSEIDLSYSGDDMTPVTDATGTVVAYQLQIPLVAAETGDSYNVEAGGFADFTRFSSNILRIENKNAFTGGGNIESTEEFLDRAETAISVRDLNSVRSIDVTLRENFSEIDDVVVIGFGDPEMIRDLAFPSVLGSKIHAGGCIDAYLRMPIIESKTFTGEIGGEFIDPREKYYVLRDDTVSDFSAVNPGDVIRVYNNLSGSEPDIYTVKEVSEKGVQVDLRIPFPMEIPVVEESGTDGEVTATDSSFKSADYDFATKLHSYNDGECISPDVFKAGSYTFSTDDLGRWIKISGSVSGNDGVYKIHVVDVSNNKVEVVDYTGTSPTFTAETDLTWDLLETDVVSWYIRIKNSSAGNTGTWKIVGLVDVDTVELRDINNNPQSFSAETGISWDLCSRIVEYSIGKNPTSYDDKVSRRYTGLFTKTVQHDGRILLPAEPVYRITDVSFASATHPYNDNGRVYFPNRVNHEPEYFDSSDLSQLQYQVIGHNPGEAPSGWQVMELDVGWPDGNPTGKDYFNGNSLRVTYDSLSGYDAVWTYMLNGDQRIICGSVIPKGLHPVYLTIDVQYKLAKTATDSLDTDDAASKLADFINNFDVKEDLDTSDITAYLRENFSVIGYIAPLTVYYDLLAPDGRVIHFKTKDKVSIDTSKVIDPDTDYYPDPAKPELLLEDPLELGVSDNTVRYLSVVDLITFTEI